MPDTLRRIAVHLIGPDHPTEVDLVLPACRPLGELLPSIVDVVFGASPPPRHWYLSFAAGVPLDTALSLQDNDVRDGDLLVLATRRIAAPRRLPTEPCGVVAACADPGSTTPRGAVLAACLAGTVVSAFALVRCIPPGPAGWPLWTAATVAAGAAAGSVWVGRAKRHLSALLVTAAVVFAVGTGILAVPAAPWQAVFLLASAAAFAVALVMLRMSPGDAVPNGFAALSAAAATSAVVSVSVTARPEVAGAVLAAVSLGALSVAPKLVVAVSGLGPSRRDVDEDRAAAAHRALTGLVTGWAAAAAVGAGSVAATTIQAGSRSGLAAAFAADIGLLLLLRQRSHVDPFRRIALGAAGSAALLATALVVVNAAPGPGFGVCAVAVAACGIALYRNDIAGEANPLLRRAIQISEYVALAAVIPLTFWLTGVYTLVRESSLT